MTTPKLWPQPTDRPATMTEILTFLERGKLDLEQFPVRERRPLKWSATNSQRLAALEAEVRDLRAFHDFAIQRFIAMHTLCLQGFFAVPHEGVMQNWLRAELHAERAEQTKLVADSVEILGELKAYTTKLHEKGFMLVRGPRWWWRQCKKLVGKL